MKRIVFMAPGASEYNGDDKILDGDPFLSEKGTEEACEAGRMLKMESLDFDVAYASYKTAAIKTLWLTLEEMHRMWIPVYKSASLDESLSRISENETIEDVLLYWEENIYPSLGLYDTILVVAHHTVLQILLTELNGQNNEDFEFPTGVPYVIEFDKDLEVEETFFIENL